MDEEVETHKIICLNSLSEREKLGIYDKNWGKDGLFLPSAGTIGYPFFNGSFLL